MFPSLVLFRRPVRLLAVGLVWCWLVVGGLPARAAEAGGRSSVNGHWEWTQLGPNLEPTVFDATFAQNGDTLTGTVTGPNGKPAPIKEGTVSGGEVRFQVKREVGGVEVVSLFKGSHKGDTVSGEIEINREGKSRTVKWLAKRPPETPAHAAALKGIWKWELRTPNGDAIINRADLEIRGTNIHGSVSMRDQKYPVAEGGVDGDSLWFRIMRKRDGRDQYSLFRGRPKGTALAGTVESTFQGSEARTRDWEALREGEFALKMANVTGIWRYTFVGHSGQVFEPTLRLQQSGEKVTGKLVYNDYEDEVVEGKGMGTNITFTVVRNRDGRELVSRFKGVILENVIRGNIEADWAGVKKTYPWEARRTRR